jgi:predicted dehydrogenase
MSKPVKIGIMGYAHYIKTNVVLYLQTCEAVEIVGVYNRGEERRKHAENDGFFATSDLDAFFKIPGMEAVFVGTANASHKELTLRAVKEGKHIICEKPLALSAAEADEMARAVEKAGLVNHVNHGGPYTEAFITFKKAVKDYAGQILHLWIRQTRAFGFWIQGARHQNVAHPEASGGWTYHHLCHALDEACIILGTSRVKRVYHVEQKSIDECPSEEIVNTFLHFEGGATAYLTDGLSIGGIQDMGVQGTWGDVRLFENSVTVTVPGPADHTQRPGNLTPFKRIIPVPPQSKMLDAVAHKFREAVRGGKNELLSFRFVADQYRILEAMKASAAAGKAVEPKYS